MALKIGKTYTKKGIGTFRVEKATQKGKAKSAVLLENGEEVNRVNFGDPDMPNAPDNEKRQGNYCSRSKSLNEVGFNANTLSRLDWECKDSIINLFNAGMLIDECGRVVTSRKKAEEIIKGA